MAKNQASKKDMCLMHSCDREVEMIAAGLCKRCYSWMRYNSEKTAEQLQERRETLSFWSDRLDGYTSYKPAKKQPKLKAVK